MAKPPAPIALNDVRDPRAGLALLAKAAGRKETPEQKRARLFWQFQFEQWQAWLDGDRLAVPRALYACRTLGKPPPRWLCEADLDLAVQGMTPEERQQQEHLQNHRLRWEAVKVARGERPYDARNKDTPLSWQKSWTAAADMLAGTGAAASAETMRGSYALIQAAGGKDVTLETYRREVRRLQLGRKRKA